MSIALLVTLLGCSAAAEARNVWDALRRATANRPAQMAVKPAEKDETADKTEVAAVRSEEAKTEPLIAEVQTESPGESNGTGRPTTEPESLGAATQDSPGLYTVALTASEERLTQQALKREAGSGVVTFPGLVRIVDADLNSLDLKPYVLPGAALRRVGNSNEYVGSLKVGVATLGLAGRHKLSTPLMFQVLEDGIADPAELTLSETSPPFETVKIKTSDLREPFTVRVASQFAPAGVSVTLAITPTLLLRSDRQSIQGFGLETTRLHVSAFGLKNPKGRRVTIEADPSAHFPEGQLTLDDSGNASTVIRSDSTGPVTLTASVPGFGEVSKVIAFAIPWRTFASSVIGGLVGGGIRVRLIRKQKSGVKEIGLALVASVLVGLVVFAAAVLGINLLPFNIPVRVGDVFVFVVSAFGAFWGAAILKPNDWAGIGTKDVP